MLRALDIPQELADAGDLRVLTGLFADDEVEPEIARKLRKGDYRVRITVGRGKGRVVSTLVSRRV